MKKIKASVLLIIMFMAIICTVKAQGDPGGGDPDPEAPLDPGSWVLVAAGVGYGVKKWRDSKQNAAKTNTDFLQDNDINLK